MNFKAICCALLFIIIQDANAQTKLKELKIGDKIPDIVVNDLIHYKETSLRLADLKGKMIILDFWATSCVPCVRSLPDMDSLQKEFPDDIAVVIVTDEKKETVERFFKNIPSIRHVGLPCVVSDTILKKLFPHISVPHEVIIDKNGIVKAITYVSGITSSNIKALLNGQTPDFTEKKTVKNIDFDKPLFIEDNGQNLLYHFLITGYYEGLMSRQGKRRGTSVNSDTRLYGTNMLLSNMYRTALLNRLATPENFPDNRIILNVKNKQPFIVPGKSKDYKEYDEWIRKNAYCFDLVVPPSMSENLYRRLKEELDNYFNFTSTIEKRKIKCFLLKSLDTGKYKSSGKDVLLDHGKNIWTIKNYPIKILLEDINIRCDYPIVNETGYEGKVDLTLVPDFKDIPSLRNQLNKYGLDLVEAERVLDVIVIADKTIE
jgi:thiol-disulfide isomerase/thioredoxin